MSGDYGRPIRRCTAKLIGCESWTDRRRSGAAAAHTRRLEPLTLTTEISLRADALDMHPDPADRFIVATALHHRARLVTKDKLIRPLGLVKTVW